MGDTINKFLRKREVKPFSVVNKDTKEAVDNHWSNIPSEITGEFVLSTGSTGAGLGQFYALKGLSLTPDESQLLVCDIYSRVVVVDARDGRSIRILKGQTDSLERPSQAVVVPQTGQVLVLESQRS
jgi:hypothetical protein